MKILKYQLARRGLCLVQMPADAKVVAVQPQDGLVTLWATVSGTADYVERKFFCVSTNQLIPDDATYLGTCQFHGGATVVHVGELP